MYSPEPDQSGRDEEQSPARQPQRARAAEPSAGQQATESHQPTERRSWQSIEQPPSKPGQQSRAHSPARRVVPERPVESGPFRLAQQQPPAGTAHGPPTLQADADEQAAEAESQLQSDPAVDVFDSAEEIVVVVDLPGYDPETIDLQAADQSLLVTAERALDEADVGARAVRRERTQHIERVVAIPAEVDLDAAVATCEDGVCRVTLPKSENARRKTIAFESRAP